MCETDIPDDLLLDIIRCEGLDGYIRPGRMGTRLVTDRAWYSFD